MGAQLNQNNFDSSDMMTVVVGDLIVVLVLFCKYGFIFGEFYF